MKVLWLNKSLKEAIDDRRIHHQTYPEHIQFEECFSEDMKNKLTEKGHKPNSYKSCETVVQGILILDTDENNAYSDPRKGGIANGA